MLDVKFAVHVERGKLYTEIELEDGQKLFLPIEQTEDFMKQMSEWYNKLKEVFIK